MVFLFVNLTTSGIVTRLQTLIGTQTLVQLTPLWECHLGCKTQHVDSTPAKNERRDLIHQSP